MEDYIDNGATVAIPAEIIHTFNKAFGTNLEVGKYELGTDDPSALTDRWIWQALLTSWQMEVGPFANIGESCAHDDKLWTDYKNARKIVWH